MKENLAQTEHALELAQGKPPGNLSHTLKPVQGRSVGPKPNSVHATRTVKAVESKPDGAPGTATQHAVDTGGGRSEKEIGGGSSEEGGDTTAVESEPDGAPGTATQHAVDVGGGRSEKEMEGDCIEDGGDV
jgi:hypothetical protein